MNVSEQPWRFFAVCIVSPFLAYKGMLYTDYLIVFFSACLFVWDTYWILYKPAARVRFTFLY